MLYVILFSSSDVFEADSDKKMYLCLPKRLLDIVAGFCMPLKCSKSLHKQLQKKSEEKLLNNFATTEPIFTLLLYRNPPEKSLSLLTPTISMKLCMWQEKKSKNFFLLTLFRKNGPSWGFLALFCLNLCILCNIHKNMSNYDCAQNWFIIYLDTHHSCANSFSCRGTSLRL